MSGFPKVPLVVGDTDDDASIHLQSRVGPARPLPTKQRSFSSHDKEILKILNEVDDELEAEYDFNKQFDIFQKSGSIPNDIEYSDNDSDADTQVESANEYEDENNKQENRYYPNIYRDEVIPDNKYEFREEKEKQKPNKSLFEEFKRARENTHPFMESSKTNYKKYALFALMSFSVTCIVLLIYQREVVFHPVVIDKPIENYYEINSKFGNLENRVNKLSLFAEDLSKRQEDLVQKHEVLSASINEKFDLVSDRFSKIDSSVINLNQFDNLWKEFTALKAKVSDSEPYINPEPKLLEISEKLNKLSKISDNIESVKSNILKEFSAMLPEKVPVYIKDNKIHYIPEFHKYIYNFIDNYQKEKNLTTNISWDQFLRDNENNMNSHINSIIKKTNLLNISKEKLENFLQKRINENNKQIWEKYNNLIDNLNIVNSNSTLIAKNLEKSTNTILLDNLLEIFAKGSNKVNYADYKLGSRILGFLTTTSTSSTRSQISQKSLPRRIFLGWFDYLNSSGVHKPKNWKYNANNVLIDGGNYWHCESNECSIGLRLSDPVILTDLIFKNPPVEGIKPPSYVSIYIKPRNSEQVNELKGYLQNKFDISQPSDQKYLKKFYKIKEVSLDSNKPINHVKFPVSLVNLKIPVKDIYIQIRSNGGITGLYNLKAYGISEFNSYKYNQEFELLIDKLSELDENEESVTNNVDIDNLIDENDSDILGDDEILF
ncbi:uncharacterized protein AC631_00659 [Debaryomyces fabryi]|uniref:SUN domain-containing protein n=1 Tax=Debaryomyces fabryi TaxID=58627 RepID=A0A0V1Q4U3_9ASCO|nr:uncharacterized protein AC631_00659 [Debaryomyces fabryi]KSA03520.1 hypothetical protein AC631_00659 [Debaryomyces fabryi]CUM54172.1 unnamed protein product [Debaryomyces fabryi]